MAQSKKEQVNIKLALARSALMNVIQNLSNELGAACKTDAVTREMVRDQPDLFRKWLAREQYMIELNGIERLFSTAKKRQGSRLILACCEGELKKSGEMCGYKIRASRSTYDRGVPNCPDEMCNRFNRPLIVEQSDDELGEISYTLGEETEWDIERKKRRDETFPEHIRRNRKK